METNKLIIAELFQYIRAEGFVFSHVADEGLMNACAGQLLRYRKQLGIEEKVAVFTDIKVFVIESL
jgi:predicted TIM-barrel enzyme